MNGSDLKEVRRARQWRQRDLASYLGVDQPAVSEMERGMRAIPEELAARIAELGVEGIGGADDLPQGSPAAGEEGSPPPGGESSVGAPSGADVPPRPTAPPPEEPSRRRRPSPPAELDLRGLEVRVLKMIQGDDVEIMVADPGETEIRRVTQHIPGLADVVGMVNEFDGQIIAANAVALSKAWVKVARENPRVRMVLETLTAGGAWRDAFAATAPVVLAILLNHGLLPSLPGLMVAPREGAGYDGARGDGASARAEPPPWGETAAGTVG